MVLLVVCNVFVGLNGILVVVMWVFGVKEGFELVGDV